MDKGQFDGLMVLKVVAEEKSFTIAAQLLGISPPAVSKVVSQLEKKLGVTLLTRTTRAVSLTEPGRIFLSQAAPAMEQIINAQKNIKGYGDRPSGTLKLNMPGVLFPFYLSKYVATFLEKYPDVKLDIYSDDQAKDIFEEGFDAGVRTDDIIAKDLTAFKIFGPIDFITAASPEYLKANGTPKHPKDLLNHNCIKHRFGSGNNIYDKWEFQDGSKEFVVSPPCNLTLNTSESIRQAALDGIGVIYTEYGNIAKDVKNKNLKIILRKFSTQSAGYYLYYPNRKQVSPALRAFIDHLKTVK